MSEKARTAVVHYNGVAYTRNISLCRRALTNRQVEGGYLHGLDDIATDIGCSRSSVSRFFAGGNLKAELTQRILGALKLTFDEVHTPIAPMPDAPDDNHGLRSKERAR